MNNELVLVKASDIYTSSVLVAEKLEVPHKVLLQTIDKLVLKQCHSRATVFKQKFLVSTFRNKMNREYPMYLMNEPAFTKLVMNLSGYAKAEEVQDIFIEAFFRMKQALLNHQNISWIDQREAGKLIRHEETDVIEEFVDYATKQGSTKAQFYYSNITKMTNKALELLVQVKDGKPLRDLASTIELSYIQVVDHHATMAIKDGMQRKMPYKEIYNLAKDEVNRIVDSLCMKPMLREVNHDKRDYRRTV